MSAGFTAGPTLREMSRRTRGKKANATRPRRGRRGLRHVDAPPAGEREPDLLSDVADAIDDHPLGLLMLVSALLAALERPGNPFDSDAERDGPSRDDLIATFLDVDRRETSALLAVIAALADDEMLRRRIHRELDARAHPLPQWVSELGRARATESAYEAVHVLGDGENIAVGVHLPGAEDTSVMAYVDHNLGTVVKDVMAVPMPLPTLIEQLRDTASDPDVTVRALDRADARARLEDAIRTGSMMFPPIETDSWPAARPLVEWVLRMLPEGGSTFPRPEWDDDAVAEVQERFFASRFGAGLDDGDHRELLGSLLWFGTDFGPGDPLRWSPSAVEILLVDWIPRKIVADVDYLAKAPALLRAWIRFCHQERGIRSTLTDETLAAVDEFEPEYQETIRSQRPQGPAALLAALGLPVDDISDLLVDEDGLPARDAFETIMLEALQRAVGGEKALDRLDTEPLPDEAFDWTGIPDDVHGSVGDVLALMDGCCDALLDEEYRTASRRLLARVAASDPQIFRRRARADTVAAAICWIVGKANYLFARGDLAVKDLAAHFGLASSTVSQRSKVLLDTLGVPHGAHVVDLGSPRYLVSGRRTQIAADRDRYHESAAALG